MKKTLSYLLHSSTLQIHLIKFNNLKVGFDILLLKLFCKINVKFISLYILNGLMRIQEDNNHL